MALTLRLVCGLTTAEIAQAFLVPEPTMAARVTRAKKKISAARIAYRVPEAAELPDRLDAVLTVVHLLYTTGHTAPAGGEPGPRRPGGARPRPGPDAARAHAGRTRGARAAGPAAADRRPPGHPRRRRGRLLLLAEQDRSRWDRDVIAEGAALVPGALRGGCPGRFARAGRDRRPARRGAELRGDRLAADRRAVRRAARGVAVARGGPQPGGRRWRWPTGRKPGWRRSSELEADGRLAGYRYLPAAKADLLRRLGRRRGSRAGVPGRAGPHRQQRRTGLPRPAASPKSAGSRARAAPAADAGPRAAGQRPPAEAGPAPGPGPGRPSPGTAGGPPGGIRVSWHTGSTSKSVLRGR